MEKNRLVDHDRETFHPERTKSTTRTTALVQVQLEPTDDLRLLEMNLEVDSQEDGSDETCHADISVRTADSKPGQEQVRVISDIFVDSNRNRSTSRSTNTLNYLAICARNNRHRTVQALCHDKAFCKSRACVVIKFRTKRRDGETLPHIGVRSSFETIFRSA